MISNENLTIVFAKSGISTHLPFRYMQWSRVVILIADKLLYFRVEEHSIELQIPDKLEFSQLAETPTILSPNGSFFGCIEDMVLTQKPYEETVSARPLYPPNSTVFNEHVAQPILKVDDLNHWVPKICNHYQKSVVPLKTRIRKRRGNIGKVLVCHDYKGGYLDDKMVYGSQNHNIYNFYQWSMIDIFVYFSHHRITIPPPSWINAAHKNGVKILGTFITEWESGVEDTLKLIHGIEGNKLFYADKLIEICAAYGFDGWLFNIETSLSKSEIPSLIKFMGYITQGIHKKIQGAQIIWYDAVTADGDLSWQNELNHFNKPFFDVTDGIFVNYFWDSVNIRKSKDIAKDRSDDVYFGIDCFGRGTFGGGGFDSYIALKEMYEHSISCALFAPSWLLEEVSPNDCYLYERYTTKFWGSETFIDIMEVKPPDYVKGSDMAWKRLPSSSGYSLIEHNPSLPSTVYISSHKWCTHTALFDIEEYEIDRDSLDDMPFIEVSEKYIGTGPEYEDEYRLFVVLFDNSFNILDEFDSGVLIASDKWSEVKHVFSHYGKGLKYISWSSRGKDREGWAGYYGTKIDKSSIRIFLNHNKNISTYVQPVENFDSMPIISTFNNGKGEAYWIKGNKVGTSCWSDMSEQDVLPDILSNINFFNSEIKVHFDYTTAWYGGSSLQVIGRTWNAKKICVFSSNVEINPNQDIIIEYAIKKLEQEKVSISLEFDDTHIYDVYDINEVHVAGWMLQRFKIPPTRKKLKLTGIYCELNPNCIYNFNLGNLIIYQDETLRNIPSPVKNLIAEQSYNLDSLNQPHEAHDITLFWEACKNADRYNIYINNIFVGRTHFPSFQIRNLHVHCETHVHVQPVSPYLDFVDKDNLISHRLFEMT